MADGEVLLSDDFGGYPEGSTPGGDWWVEGGQEVRIQDGRLRVKANPEGDHQPGFVCTVWHKAVLSGDVELTCDTQVIASTVKANNINFFLFYSDPSGRPLYETRASRASAAYADYHYLNGYIFTFLNDWRAEGGRRPDGTTKARFRMRRCPGFQLMTETYDSECREGVTYKVTIRRKGGELTFAVDGHVYLKDVDPEPLAEGLFGFRTFQTDLWWDNLKVVRI
jgi:hypothetical protein